MRTQQKVLTWLCVCPSTHNTSQSRKQCYAIFSASVLAAVSCNVISKCGIFSKICVEWFRSSAGCSSSRYFSLKLLERPSIFCCDLPLFYNYTGVSFEWIELLKFKESKMNIEQSIEKNFTILGKSVNQSRSNGTLNFSSLILSCQILSNPIEWIKDKHSQNLSIKESHFFVHSIKNISPILTQ